MQPEGSPLTWSFYEEVLKCAVAGDFDDFEALQSLEHAITLLLQSEEAVRDRTELTAIGIKFYNKCRELPHMTIVGPTLRELACRIVEFGVGDPSHASPVEKLNLFGCYGRAGVLWNEANDSAGVIRCLTKAVQIWDQIGGVSSITTLLCGQQQQDMMEQHSETLQTLAKAMTSLGHTSDAFAVLQRTEEIMAFIPHEMEAILRLYYDTGMECHRASRYTDAIQWIEAAHNLAQRGGQCDKGLLNCMLRTLANAYIEQKQYEKAQSCLFQANASDDPNGLYVYIKLHAARGEISEAVSCLQKLLSHPEKQFSLCCIACKELVAATNFSETSVNVYKQLAERFPADPNYSDVRIQLLGTMLLSPATHSTLEELADSIVADHTSGTHALEEEMLHSFQTLLWEKGASEYQALNLDSCNTWFHRLRTVLSSERTEQRATVERILSLCACMQQKYDEAIVHGRTACACENSCSSWFQLLKAMLGKRQTQKQEDINDQPIAQALSSLCATPDFKPEHLAVIGDAALRSKCPFIAETALEKLLQECSDPVEINSEMKRGIIIRNLINLKMERSGGGKLALIEPTGESKDDGDMDVDQPLKDDGLAACREDVLRLLTSAAVALEQLRPFTVGNLQNSFGTLEEIEWLLNTSWNVGCNACSAGAVEHSYQAYKLAYAFTKAAVTMAAEKNRAALPYIHSVQRQCLILWACSALDLEGRPKAAVEGTQTQTQIDSERAVAESRMKEVLTCVELGRALFKGTTAPPTADEPESKESAFQHKAIPVSDKEDVNQTLATLTLFEFHARARLGDKGLHELLEKAKAQFGVDAGMFERMAVFAKDSPYHNDEVALEALQLSLQLYLRASPIDYARCARLFRLIILYCPTKAESLKWFEQATQLSADAPQGQYPMLELDWLASLCWNYGVYFYRTSKFKHAERFMSLSLGLAAQVPTFQARLPELNKAYAKVLAAAEKGLAQIG